MKERKKVLFSESVYIYIYNNNNNNNNLFHQESNTFGTIILKHFTERTQLPKRPPKSTQAFQGENIHTDCVLAVIRIVFFP